MSFYGKVYATIGNAFKRLKFDNSGKNNEAIPTNLPDSLILEAHTSSDHAPIKSNNRWITFAESDGACLIGHGSPGSEAGQIDIIGAIGNAATYDGLITFGDIITINCPTYDSAGHIVGYTAKKYKLEEVPEVSDVIATVEDVQTINTVLGLPLADGVELPNESLIDRVANVESVNTDQDERLNDLEDIAETVLDMAIDPETGLAVSGLERRVTALEKMIGDLEDIGMIMPEGKDMSVTNIFGDFTEVSGGRRSLADILGNLDHEVGEQRNFAEELGTLQRNVALILKHLDLV